MTCSTGFLDLPLQSEQRASLLLSLNYYRSFGLVATSNLPVIAIFYRFCRSDRLISTSLITPNDTTWTLVIWHLPDEPRWNTCHDTYLIYPLWNACHLTLTWWHTLKDLSHYTQWHYLDTCHMTLTWWTTLKHLSRHLPDISTLKRLSLDTYLMTHFERLVTLHPMTLLGQLSYDTYLMNHVETLVTTLTWYIHFETLVTWHLPDDTLWKTCHITPNDTTWTLVIWHLPDEPRWNTCHDTYLIYPLWNACHLTLTWWHTLKDLSHYTEMLKFSSANRSFGPVTPLNQPVRIHFDRNETFLTIR